MHIANHMTSPNTDNIKPKLEFLQLIRAIAAILVVCFHVHIIAVKTADHNGLFQIFSRGMAGVDLFFVLSGFIIFYTASLKKNQTKEQFLIARFWRIVPIYWAVVSIYIMVGLLNLLSSNSVPVTYDLTVMSFITSIFLLPLPHHLMDISWTLSLELVFYLLFAATFFRFGAKAVLIGLAIWGGLSQIVVLGWGRETYFQYLFHGNVIEFLFGALIAVVYLKGNMPFARSAFWLGAIGLLMWLGGVHKALDLPIASEWGAGVSSALLIYGGVQYRRAMPKWILLLGEASYILYLSHGLVFSFCERLLAKIGINAYAADISMLGLVLAAIFVACVLTVYVERPFRAWYKGRSILPFKAIISGHSAQKNRPKGGFKAKNKTKLT